MTVRIALRVRRALSAVGIATFSQVEAQSVRGRRTRQDHRTDSRWAVTNPINWHDSGLTQVPLTEDQHPVGDLGSDGQDEAFGEAVRPRTPRRDLDHLDARVRQDRVERTPR